VGTTDTPYEGSLEEPPVEKEDLDVLMRSVTRAFGGDLTSEDVLASWAGVRPLLDRGGGPTRDLSRRHFVVEDPPGLLTVTGGKLTTYRAMAEDVVDRICRALRLGGECRTREIALGLTGPLSAALERAGREAERAGLQVEAGERLVHRYGDDWEEALASVRKDPTLGEVIVPGLPVLRIEATLARSREMALTEDDVLVRRTRLATMDAAAAAALTI
jgi:glycerol-3-phosphate dehydrogenase